MRILHDELTQTMDTYAAHYNALRAHRLEVRELMREGLSLLLKSSNPENN